MREAKDIKDEFEQSLTQAMRRVNATETLARFLAAAAEVEADRNLPRAQRRHRWAFAAPAWLVGWRLGAASAVAATLLLGTVGAERVHQRREAQRAELAEQQFATAIGITNHALDQTRARLEHAGVTLGE